MRRGLIELKLCTQIRSLKNTLIERDSHNLSFKPSVSYSAPHEEWTISKHPSFEDLEVRTDQMKIGSPLLMLEEKIN